MNFVSLRVYSSTRSKPVFSFDWLWLCLVINTPGMCCQLFAKMSILLWVLIIFPLSVQLLFPHFRYTLNINTEGRASLFGPTGSLSEVWTFNPLKHTVKLNLSNFKLIRNQMLLSCTCTLWFSHICPIVFGRSAFSIRAANFWNTIPSSIRQCSTFFSLKQNWYHGWNITNHVTINHKVLNIQYSISFFVWCHVLNGKYC